MTELIGTAGAVSCYEEKRLRCKSPATLVVMRQVNQVPGDGKVTGSYTIETAVERHSHRLLLRDTVTGSARMTKGK